MENTNDNNPKKTRRKLWILYGIGFGVILAGFLGVDRWFYETVSWNFNTTDNPARDMSELIVQDNYQKTKWFWDICRMWTLYGGVLVYFIIVMFYPRDWRWVNAGLLTVVSVALTANIAQAGIARFRPNEAETQLAFDRPFARWWARIEGSDGKGYGLPSAEVAAAMAIAYVLTRIAPKTKGLFYVPALLVLLARWLPGDHYLSDVVAGMLLGLALSGLLFEWLVRQWPFIAKPAG